MVTEVEQPSASEAPPKRLSVGRRIAIWALIVVASIITFVSILTTWVNRQMLDGHSWHKASSQVIQDPAVQSALAAQLVNELYANVDVSAELQKRLPKNLQGLADPVAGALRAPSVRGVEFLLSQPRFQALFVRAADVAHEKLVNVLENKTGHGIDTGNGAVTIDLTQLLKDIGTELGLPGAALDRIPADSGTITILKSDQLQTAQRGVRAIRVLSVWLFVLVFALFGLALYLAHQNRRRTLAYIGWGLVVVGVLTLIARRLIGNYILSAIVNDTYRTPVHHIWLIETSILGAIGLASVIYGFLLILAAVLAGPWRASVAVRREIAPILNQRSDITWGSAGILYLLLILWGPTHALRTWWGILLIGALFALGIYLLRRQTLEEFPTAGLEPSEASLGARMTAAAQKVTDRSGKGEKAGASSPSTAEELAKLVDMKEKGALTEDEFEQAKKHVLASA